MRSYTQLIKDLLKVLMLCVFVLILGLVVIFVVLDSGFTANGILIIGALLCIWSIFTKKLHGNKKSFIILALVCAIGGYLVYPKTVTSCGVLATGPSCQTILCRGIAYSGFTEPQCIGVSHVISSTAPSYLDPRTPTGVGAAPV